MGLVIIYRKYNRSKWRKNGHKKDTYSFRGDTLFMTSKNLQI